STPPFSGPTRVPQLKYMHKRAYPSSLKIEHTPLSLTHSREIVLRPNSELPPSRVSYSTPSIRI
ncbi:MAG: hypothetical protein ACE5KO_05515, partial [Candidatus Bathyarchaeia archaeon]